jgi:integrase
MTEPSQPLKPYPIGLLFKLLAVTGLRVSEAIGLQWRHVQLDGSTPHVRVRRRIVDCNVGPPKSKRSRRDVPLPMGLVRELRAERGDAEALVFSTRTGTPLHVRNVRRRYLQPAAEEAGAPWTGFHTFRHTAGRCCLSAARTRSRFSGG